MMEIIRLVDEWSMMGLSCIGRLVDNVQMNRLTDTDVDRR